MDLNQFGDDRVHVCQYCLLHYRQQNGSA